MGFTSTFVDETFDEPWIAKTILLHLSYQCDIAKYSSSNNNKESDMTKTTNSSSAATFSFEGNIVIAHGSKKTVVPVSGKFVSLSGKIDNQALLNVEVLVGNEFASRRIKKGYTIISGVRSLTYTKKLQ